MRTHHALPTLAVTALLLVLAATPAWAHAGFDVRQVPAGETFDVELRVPIERDAGNEFVDALFPSGWEVLACDGAEGWSCDTVVEDDGDTVVNLARDSDDASTVERFALTLAAPTDQGTYAFPVVQGYDDGTEAAWIGEPDTDRPAPTVQVGDDATPIERSTELPRHGDPADAVDEPADEGTDGEPDDASPSDTEPTADVASPSEEEAASEPASDAAAASDDAASDDEGADAASEEAAAVEDETADDAGSTVLLIVIAVVVGLGLVAALLVSRQRS